MFNPFTIKVLIGLGSAGIVITGTVLISPRNNKQSEDIKLEMIGKEENELQNIVSSKCGDYASAILNSDKKKEYEECEKKFVKEWSEKNKKLLEKHKQSFRRN